MDTAQLNIPDSKVVDFILSEPWLITPEYYELILAIAERRSSDKLEAFRISEARLESYNQFKKQSSKGSAVIPIIGPIAPRMDFFTAISGGATVEGIQKDLILALNNKDVHTIVLYMDTPGGQLTGIEMLAETVYFGRQTKKIIAYGFGMVASAGYFIASAASEIWGAETSMFGSIGVITSYREKKTDNGKRDIVSSQSPYKGLDPGSDEGKVIMQKFVDDIATVFIGKVARNRNVSAEYVKENFGKGSVLLGNAAVQNKMIDKISTGRGLVHYVNTLTGDVTMETPEKIVELTNQNTELTQKNTTLGQKLQTAEAELARIKGEKDTEAFAATIKEKLLKMKGEKRLLPKHFGVAMVALMATQGQKSVFDVKTGIMKDGVEETVKMTAEEAVFKLLEDLTPILGGQPISAKVKTDEGDREPLSFSAQEMAELAAKITAESKSKGIDLTPVEAVAKAKAMIEKGEAKKE